MTKDLRRRSGLALLLITVLVPAPRGWAQGGGAIATEKIFDAIGVREGATVCEVGAGDGELTLAAARLVGPGGRVLTSELGAERVKVLQERVAAGSAAHVTVVAGEAARTNFPDAACDALFMRNVYHHFADPAAMNASISAAIKPGGRLAIVDFSPPAEEAPRPGDRSTDGMHGLPAASLSRELGEAGFEPVASELGSQRWFMVVVSKPRR